MALISILISLLIERFLGSLEELRQFAWFSSLARTVKARVSAQGAWSGTAGVVLVVGPPVLVVALVASVLADIWLFFGFAFSLGVLLYSLGPRDLDAEVEAFLDAHERGDDESAYWHASELLKGEAPDDARELTRDMVQDILIAAHERILAVIFWFVVLGPTGAALYRLSSLLKGQTRAEDNDFAAAASRLYEILAWVPAHLAALSYALGGSFVDAVQSWRERASEWDEHNHGVLVSSGFGALQYHPETETGAEADAVAEAADILSAMALVRRAVVIWLAAIAVFTLAGWAA